MATFMESCRCKGARPQGIVGHTFSSRPDLVGRMLHDRHVARFIVAPPGYGKSTIAFEYANIMFGFKRVLWIRCASPCFLRDLDAGVLLPSLVEAVPDADLVVCDDVPVLDDERAAAFDAFVDGLLGRGCEAIVTCTPAADTFSHLQRDRMLLDGSDLLLTDDELSIALATGTLDGSAARDLPSCERAACLVWHGDGMRMLVRGAAAEEVPSEVALSMVALLMLGGGTADDLAAILSAERAAEVWEFLADDYPYLGMDRRTGIYAPMQCSIALLAAAFSQKLEDLAAASLHAERGAFLECIADLLLQRGCDERAAEIMVQFAPKQTACAWLARSCRRLIAAGHPLAVSTLHESVRRRASGFTDQLSLCRCWSAMLLDDADTLELFANRVARAGSADARQRLMALSFLIMHGAQGARERVAAKLAHALKGDDGAAAQICGSDPLCGDALVFARVCVAAAHGIFDGVAAWMQLREEHADGAVREALLFCAAWLFERLMEEDEEQQARPSAAAELAAARDDLAAMATFCRDEARGTHQDDAPDWFALNAALHASAACDRWVALTCVDIDEDTRMRAHQMDLIVREQIERCEALARRARASAASSATRSRGHAHPARSSKSAAASTATPILTVNLFGGMEVRIGGELVEPRFLRRMKVKTLLALLVIHRGREMSRDSLAAMLWPESTESSYRNNFYSVWSQLKRSLQVQGSCPYLIRTQTGCSLDPRLVVSDVHEYEAICRALLFGTDAASDWERLYSLVSTEYAGRLMPCEQENETILSLRDHYHAQLIDGLIATTNRLVGLGEPRGAVWFAREALRREAGREDVYIALMEAQIAADQRSAALETYFECRRFLNEQLGIDPSKRLVGLYRSIIEEEEILV